MTKKLTALALVTALISACASRPIHVRVSSDSQPQTQKRGALGGVPGGGFIPPTKLVTGGGGGDITQVNAGNGLTGGAVSGIATINVVGSSDFAVAADSIDLSTAVTMPGTLEVEGATTVNDTLAVTGLADSITITASNNFANNSDVYGVHGSLTGTYSTAGGATHSVGVYGSALGTESGGGSVLRNTGLRGDAANADENWALWTERGDVRLNVTSGVTRIDGATTVDDTLVVTGTAGVTGLLTATAGGTTPLNWTTTGTGDLVSADDLTVADDATIMGLAAVVGVGATDSSLIVTTQANQNGFRVNNTATGQTATNKAGAVVVHSATYDTTAGNTVVAGYRYVGSAVESAGANLLITYGYSAEITAGDDARGFYANVTGANSNFSFFGDEGTLRNDGSTTLGDSASLDSHTINGRTTLTSQDLTNNALLVTRNAAASTSTDIASVRASNTSTHDTTAGALNAIGVFGTATATRSAGANNLTNIGGVFTAAGAQVNRALQTNDGNVLLNAVSGDTTANLNFVVNDTATLGSSNADVHTFRGAISHTDDGAGSYVLTTTPADRTTTLDSVFITGLAGTFDTTSGALNGIAAKITATSTRSAGANDLTNKALLLSASGAQSNIALETTAGANYLNTASGTTCVGCASGATTVGKFEVNTTAASLHTARFNHVPVASTATNLAILSAVNNGTYDATGAAKEARGLDAVMVSTRSAGANNLTNVAGRFDASGGQVNIALLTNNGNNYLNATSGFTGIGLSAGSSNSGKLDVRISAAGLTASQRVISASSTTATFDTTAGALTNTTLFSESIATRSAGANNLTNTAAQFSASGGQINIALTTASGDNYLNSTSGNTGIGVSSGGALAGKLRVTNTTSTQAGISLVHTPVAGVTSALAVLRADGNGTYDTSGGGISAHGVYSVLTSTRSSGASNLTNIALRGDATGGQVNIALLTDAGSNYLNATSGSTGVGYAGGAALPSKLSVSGTATITGATDLDSTLNVDGVSTLRLTTITDAAVAATANRNAATVIQNSTFSTAGGDLESYGLRVTNTATKSGGGSSLFNVGLYVAATDAAVGEPAYAIKTVGDSWFGESSTYANTHYFFGDVEMQQTFSPGGIATALDITVDGGHNSGDTFALSIAKTGSEDTTAGAMTSYGIESEVATTRTAGAPSLTNVAARLSARDAQVNIALTTDEGGNFLNTGSGNTAIGYAIGAAPVAKLSVLGATGQDAVSVSHTATGQTVTDKALLQLSNTGSYNTTVGNINAFGVRSIISATESAGGNLLQTFGVYGKATAGDWKYGGYFVAETGNQNIALVAIAAGTDSNAAILANAPTVFHHSRIDITGNDPTLSVCGTAPATGDSTSNAGTITAGTSTAGTCTVTFGAPTFATAPTCVVSSRSGVALTYTTSAAALSVTAGITDGMLFDYVCFDVGNAAAASSF